MIIMMIFNMSTSYFRKISFRYFEDYLMMKLTLGQGIPTSYQSNINLGPNTKTRLVWKFFKNV
jgi:hypothetical protein